MTGEEKKNKNDMKVDEKSKCLNCEEGAKTIECDWCKKWMCWQCSELSKAQQNRARLTNAKNGLVWLCQQCA